MFDLLLRSQEPVSARHVAQELSTSVDGMERLLDALVGIEILEVETKDGTGEGGGVKYMYFFYNIRDLKALYRVKSRRYLSRKL